MNPANHANLVNPVSTSSYQQRVHQRCDAFRSSSGYSAESGNRLTTSRSSSLKSAHRFSPRFSHRGQLSCDFMLNNSYPLNLDIYYQTVLV
jgi:hypothetical protein